MAIPRVSTRSGRPEISRWARANDRYRRITGSLIWELLGEQQRWIVGLVVLTVGSFAAAIGTDDDDGGLQIESVDPNARRYSTWPRATDGVTIEDDGGIESRWCTKQARPR